jgi:hypothetical protein
MNFKSKVLDNIAGKWLKKQDQAIALKRIGDRLDWKATATKCHHKLSIEYKFWIVKDDSNTRDAKLKDMGKDIAFMNTIENKETITPEQLYKLQQVKMKYGIE